jgi:protoporphyrinogen oxidase
MTTPIASMSHSDVVLVGAGIMSATPAVFLKELDPSLKIEIYEVLGQLGSGKLECVEQRRHRPCGTLRVELHSKEK